MKNRGLILLIFFIMIFPIINADITGHATSQGTGVSVTVVSGASLSIDSPTNKTYTEGDYILLDYTANLIDTVWYNIDGEANATINASFYFTKSVGVHTLYLYGNLSNGTLLSDNVTFTVQAQPSGGGRSHAKVPTVITEEEITIEEEKIPINLKQTETKEIKILLTNEKEEVTLVRLEDQNLNDLLTRISDIEFYLNPGESKEVTITFFASGNKAPDLYIEKLLLKTDDSEKEILFYVEVESLDYLFDVSLEIPAQPTIYKPGDNLISQLTFYNLGKQGETDINIEYLIKDLNEKIIFGEKQILVIGTSISLSKVFKLPDNIQEGEYIFYVKVTYDNKIASASKLFSVVEKGPENTFEKAFSYVKDAVINNQKLIAQIIATLIGAYIIYGIAYGLMAGKRKRRRKTAKKKRR